CSTPCARPSRSCTSSSARPATPPSATPCPYTTLFRSLLLGGVDRLQALLEQGLHLVVGGLALPVHAALGPDVAAVPPATSGPRRSEEHTSELQSRFDVVCRLLLEQKKHKL